MIDGIDSRILDMSAGSDVDEFLFVDLHLHHFLLDGVLPEEPPNMNGFCLT